MKPIIKVENLSKEYRLGVNQTPYSTLRESLMSAVKFPVKAFRKNNSANSENVLWALKDVGFEVMPGEVVGIIGRNGAGKSTLLKILSRITEPTTGRIELYGRVGSLLEVGTGFHPELTGRENIFLNGAILGMRQAEIARKFDEIVDFAEIEKFIDTPVKFYSSGMYTRLAFAVAANLEPEILIVDEVLAVGDAEFQKKCLGKMSEVASQGRTVLFVSHNIKAIQQLCSTCLLLKDGVALMKGETSIVAHYYMKTSLSLDNNPLEKASIVDIRVYDINGNETNLWNYYEKIKVEITVMVNTALNCPSLDISFYSNNLRLFAFQSDKMTEARSIEIGDWKVEFEIELAGLVAEEIYFDIGIREKKKNYFLLVEQAKKLMPNYSTIPKDAVTDCILLPKATCSWNIS